MNNEIKLLSDIVVYTKYAKYIPQLRRRETWEEIVNRYLNMMVKKFPNLANEILKRGELLHSKKLLMSMRAAQFSGVAAEKNEARVFNCSYMPMDSYKCFGETMFLLLTGCGVGYSVQQHHIEKMPTIRKALKIKKYVIGDNIEGWSDAVKVLIKSYTGNSNYKPRFVYSDIREKGARLVTSGGKAPGPAPLKLCLTKIDALLNEKKDGDSLSSLEIHDIQCYIADAVLAGGIRRAAMIALFSMRDKEMLTCKFGNWWETNPQRGRCNNSVVAVRSRFKEEDFNKVWNMIKESGSGEPGISLTDNQDWGFNPCHEIALRPYTFCNLIEINGGAIENRKDFLRTCDTAAFFGTLQASFTDFHYLRPIWKKNSEKDSLIGISITGIANGNILKLRDQHPSILKDGVNVIRDVNKHYAEEIKIQPSARLTTVKPAGTTSVVLGSSSGIHAWHSKFYIRNIQCKVGDDLYTYFINNHPKLIKHMDYQADSAVIGIPQRAPSTGILRESETALDMLERVKMFNIEWVREGHNSGSNYNNVSATVNINPDEWKAVGKWMWKNRNIYSGLSVIPFDGGTYKDAPFMTVSKKRFDDLVEYIQEHPINLTKIVEEEDNTTQSETVACGPQGCELT